MDGGFRESEKAFVVAEAATEIYTSRLLTSSAFRSMN